jgi:hypothetical protein
MTTATQTFLHEARNWIAEVFEVEEVDSWQLTDQEVIDGINRHYSGGWGQFRTDNATLVED